MKSTNENLLLWEQRIKERVQDGLTVDEWCLKNEMTKNQYYYWNRRIHKNQKSDVEVIFLQTLLQTYQIQIIQKKNQMHTLIFSSSELPR